MVRPRNPQPPDSQSFDDAIQRIRTRYQNGERDEAERGYRELLSAHPANAELNHDLGVLLWQAKRIHEALPMLRTALERQPKTPQYWLSYIAALNDAGQR